MSEKDLFINDIMPLSGKVTRSYDDVGYLTAEAILTRPGKSQYKSSEVPGIPMTSDYVYLVKTEENLKDPNVLKTFMLKPLTINHPEEKVTPENWDKYSVGEVVNVWWDDEDKSVRGKIAIKSKEAIDLVTKNQIDDISLGYSFRVTPTENPLIYTQQIINVNHAAIVKDGRISSALICDSAIKLEKTTEGKDNMENKKEEDMIEKKQDHIKIKAKDSLKTCEGGDTEEVDKKEVLREKMEEKPKNHAIIKDEEEEHDPELAKKVEGIEIALLEMMNEIKRHGEMMSDRFAKDDEDKKALEELKKHHRERAEEQERKEAEEIAIELGAEEDDLLIGDTKEMLISTLEKRASQKSSAVKVMLGGRDLRKSNKESLNFALDSAKSLMASEKKLEHRAPRTSMNAFSSASVTHSDFFAKDSFNDIEATVRSIYAQEYKDQRGFKKSTANRIDVDFSKSYNFNNKTGKGAH